MMQNARKQAEDYVFRLDADHAAPPFIITCDVGHALELYADFTGTGRAYSQFPDRKGFRIFLEDLRNPGMRALLATVWTKPETLDPTKVSARVTREIAKRLAAVSKALEASHPAEDVAHFLMRCIFTMFAEDVDLLPKGKFTKLLEECVESPAHFAPLVEELWAKMDEPQREKRFFSHFVTYLRHFNGNLFKGARAFPLGREEIGELLAASRANWTEVDPAIFGTLLEQALDPKERRKLGAHYTPRAYVERLVEATVMQPLRADWQAALSGVEDAKEDGDEGKAAALARAFLHRLCETRVLDPACGTGNFLYVALEMMKKLEGEVLETLAELGETESLGLETVDPHQFLGLELNPRAAAIAELVVWIGYLQQHYRTHSGHPDEPILRAFRNINFGERHGYDAVLTWDGYPLPKVVEKDGKRVETYPNPRRPVWPEAEFIVGNPPFIGGKDIRSRLPPGYAEALWAAHRQMNESADFVMYWWDRAADLLLAAPVQAKVGKLKAGQPLAKAPPRRFGFVTTNSISQVFQRRVMERHLNARKPLSLIYAVPDHPWTKATADSAAVRIAMTVAEAGTHEGVLNEVVAESGLETDEPHIQFVTKTGKINSDLTVGVDVTQATQLTANDGMCFRGITYMGAGFIIDERTARHFVSQNPESHAVIKRYLSGRDVTSRERGMFAIDLFGRELKDIRTDFPHIYQHLLETVKPIRDLDRRTSYREKWFIFAEPRSEFREASKELTRYIVTSQTAKYRIFRYAPTDCLPDQTLVAVTSEDYFIFAILSSSWHSIWSFALGGWLGVGNDHRYSNSKTFACFPFPDPPLALRQKLRAAGEELDALRKRVLAEHPDLTLTGLYNVLEKLKKAEPLDERDEDVKARGLVLILKELHETIDRLTAEAYGWPADLADEDILARLVALNAERAAEEAAGHVRWLRPDYQIPRFARGAAAKTAELDLGTSVVAIDRALPDFPASRYDQPLAVEALLAASNQPMTANEIARGFRRGGKRIAPRIAQALDRLALYGRITALPDGRYAARKAA